jgi:hypothetical protein
MAITSVSATVGKITRPFKFKEEDLLEVIRKSAMKIEDHARILQDARVLKDGETIKENTAVIKDIKGHTVAIKGDTGFIRDQCDAIRRTSETSHVQVNEINENVTALGLRFEEMKSMYDERIELALASQNSVAQMLKEMYSSKRSLGVTVYWGWSCANSFVCQCSAKEARRAPIRAL